jgi:hypothetical protein
VQAETWWTALPQTLPRSRRLGALKNRFGPAGPYTFVVILALATEQYYATNRATRQEGLLNVGWDELAYLVGASVAEARAIVALMAALDPPLIELRSSDDLGATIFLPKWSRWHPGPKDPEATERKRRQRERDALEAAHEPTRRPRVPKATKGPAP